MELNVFIPLLKVDEEKRLVYGQITAEQPDAAGEIMDYISSKPFYEKWSGDFAKTTDGRSLGNVRAMHKAVAAGKLVSINFDDDAKTIHCCAKVVDDAEWNKVLEGVYTGFSQGGKYAKRWPDPSNPVLTRFTADPSEVSLVDSPCLKSSTFTVMKVDGSTELRKFKDGEAAPTNSAPDVTQGWKAKDGSFHLTKAEAMTHNAKVDAGVMAKAAAVPALDALAGLSDVLAKKEGKSKDDDSTAKDDKKPYGDVEYADDGLQEDKKKRYPIDTKEHIKAAWNYINTENNQKPYTPEQVKTIKAKIVTAWKKEIDKDGPPSAVEKMAKGMYTVSSLANLLEQIQWLTTNYASEQVYEGDEAGMAQIANFKAWLATGADLLVAMVAMETEELKSSGEDEDVEVLECCAKGEFFAAVHLAKGDLQTEMKKAGARNSKSDKTRIQSMHDNAVELGADCGGKVEKALGDTDLLKLLAERDAFKDQLEKIAPSITAITERLAKLEAQPLPGGPVLRPQAVTVTKGSDLGGASGGNAAEDFKKHLESLPEDQRTLALMKAALAAPMGSAPTPAA